MMARRNFFCTPDRRTLAPGFFALALLCLGSVAAPSARSQSWTALGPAGGDARTLAADHSHPEVVYLGTTDGHIFRSENGGRRWQLLGLAGSSRDAIITSILVDPRSSDTLFASTWTREKRGEGGGIFRSTDGGRTWRASGLAGHAVRALVAAPSDPDTLVAGALDGVFRSRDAGKNWEMITPAGDSELRNFDSLAIDPQNPEIIYAGTFHLPWKTTDGGQDWTAIHEGMIDDSDVLSLAVNSSNPAQIFASACSGVYRSDDAGGHWKRMPGLPDSSRRTLVIRFDPASPGTLYAGTTQGLWKATDSGAQWRRVSPSDWVINSLVILQTSDEPAASRVLIGTEQQGVLAGSSGGGEFEFANDGFEHRRVVALSVDRENPGRLSAVLANASDPVVQSSDAGKTWTPLGSGLGAGTVRRVFSTPDGWWAAVASGGLMRLDSATGGWVRAGSLVEGERGQSRAAFQAVSASSAAARAFPAGTPFRASVNDFATSDRDWFAATDDGLFTSSDAGATWALLHFSSLALPVNSVRVSADGTIIRIVSSHGMVFSDDAGRSWKWHDLPLDSYGPLRLEIADESTLLATSPTGLYISRDAGATWTRAQAGLPASAIDDLLVRPDFWAASVAHAGLYVSLDRGVNWTRIAGPRGLADPDYFPVLAAGISADRIYAGSENESLYLLDLSRPAVLANRVESGH